MSERKTKGWAISGTWRPYGKKFLYVGFFYTRKDAILNHCNALGRDWEWCKRNGAKAVKVTVTWDDEK